MRVFRLLLLGLVVVLIATGIPLIWLYSPAPHADWTWLRTVHRGTSRVLVNAAMIYLVVIAVRRQDRWRTPHAAGFASLVLAFSFSGFLLPWDQLGLWAVTVGTKMRGVFVALSGQVRFLIIGGAEISKDTYRPWVLLHLVGLPLAGLGGLWLVRRRVGSRPHAVDVGTPPVRRDDAVARHGDPQPHA